MTGLDSLDLSSGFYISGGAGLSIGGSPVFTLWSDGLPSGLLDFGLADSSFSGMATGDTLGLRFQTRKAPDVYNMMFPLSISVGKISGRNRFATSGKSGNEARSMAARRAA